MRVTLEKGGAWEGGEVRTPLGPITGIGAATNDPKKRAARTLAKVSLVAAFALLRSYRHAGPRGDVTEPVGGRVNKSKRITLFV